MQATRMLLAIFLVFMPLVAGGGSVTQSSVFWATSGIGDGVSTGYSSDQWAWVWRMLFLNDPTTQGVSAGYLNELEVTNPAGRTLRVASGGGLGYGYAYRNTSDVDLTLTLPVIGDTGWRLVLRASWAAQTVRPVLLESADGVAAIPALTQTAGVTWEISLASGTITTVPVVAITDLRSFFLDNGRIANRPRRFSVGVSSGYNQTGAAQIFQITSRGIIMPDAADSIVNGFFAVPTDYVAGTAMVVTAVIRPAASGNLRATNGGEYAGCGEIFFIDGQTTVATTPVTLNENECVNSVTLTNIAAGDLVSLSFLRIGTDVLDTIGDAIDFVGWYIDYTADM